MNHSSPDVLRDTLPDTSALDRLSKLCAQELTASHTYQLALTLPAVSSHSEILSRCYASHRMRAAAIADRIAIFRGKPPKSGGVWSGLLPALSASPASTTAKDVIARLEEAEDCWVRNYREEVAELDRSNREFLHHTIIVAQDATHAVLRDLKHAVHG